MKPEYDFSKGERGKYYDANAKHNLPIYLDSDVLDYFLIQSKSKGVELSHMVNDLLKKDIAIIEGVK